MKFNLKELDKIDAKYEGKSNDSLFSSFSQPGTQAPLSNFGFKLDTPPQINYESDNKNQQSQPDISEPITVKLVSRVNNIFFLGFLERFLIILKDKDCLYFRLKQTTMFEKVIISYCERKGITDVNSCVLTFDGDVIQPNQTPLDVC